jgi:Fe-S-cluster containining protein
VHSQASLLCLACGVCCTEALHRAVEVRPEHVIEVRSLGLTVEPVTSDGPGAGGGRHAFSMPCPLYLDQKCSVYPKHPPSCRDFRCALLRKLDEGGIELDAAIEIAGEARALMAEGAARPLAPGEPDPAVVLGAAALDVLLTKHFR